MWYQLYPNGATIHTCLVASCNSCRLAAEERGKSRIHGQQVSVSLTIIKAVLEIVRSRIEEMMGPTHRYYHKVANRLTKSTGRSTPTEPQSIPLLSLVAKVVV